MADDDAIDVVIDLETTGLPTMPCAAIIEIAAATVDLPYPPFHTYCNPGERYLGPEADAALEKNHISRETIRASSTPSSSEAAYALHRWLHRVTSSQYNTPLRFHAFNNPFEQHFLSIHPWNLPEENEYGEWGNDIMVLAARGLSEFRNRISLDKAVMFYGVERKGEAHTALGDVLTEVELFKVLRGY